MRVTSSFDPTAPRRTRVERFSAVSEMEFPQTAFDASAVLQVQAEVLAQNSFAAAASAFVRELATRMGAAKVYLGHVEKGGVVIAAISTEPDFVKHAEACRIAAAAMQESIEQGASLGFPAVTGSRPRITLAHAEMARRHAASVLTVPLVLSQRVFGAVSLEFHGAALPGAPWVASLEHMAGLITPVLELKHELDRPWHQRLVRTTREFRLRVAGPNHLGLKFGLISGALALSALCFWPVAYRVSAPARLEGSIQRVLVAPADGFLREALVKPGDLVVAGQVLATLADHELELERRKWSSEIAQYENSYRTALAKGERTQFVVNAGKADSARAQLALVEQQIGRTQIRAPFEGIIIKGDLSQRLGAPVQRGDVLLTLSPANNYRVIVDVDERDINDVKVGRPGALALSALPDAIVAFTVARVTPVATAKDGQNVYEIEGRIDDNLAALRPGLQGVAKIDAGERSTAWVWTHRFVDWARLQFWWLAR